MRCKTLFCIFLVILILGSLSGCIQSTQDASTPVQGLRMPVDGLPNVSDFSGEALEGFGGIFSPVQEAVLYRNGEARIIPTDDPRLISLLNFIANSINSGTCWMEQGYVSEERVESILEYAGSCLEIFLNHEKEGSSLSRISKMYILGSGCLLYVETADLGTQVDWYFPYMSLLEDMVANGKITDEEFRHELDEEWPQPPWLELIEYAGFQD